MCHDVTTFCCNRQGGTGEIVEDFSGDVLIWLSYDGPADKSSYYLMKFSAEILPDTNYERTEDGFLDGKEMHHEVIEEN